VDSSSAATNTTHLTALGVELNNNGSGQPLFGTGTALGLFDGQSPAITDVLVKYTYYGDANLDGKIDASDYSRIDNGFLNHLTGWSNGDINYDGVINGSDYTLIDNAFNMQGATLAAEMFTATAGSDAATSIVKSNKDAANTATFSPANVFQTTTQITFADLAPLNVESLLQKRDVLDRLTASYSPDSQ
jgi:hypothetical protein